MGRIYALLILAWALIRSLLAPLTGSRRGLAAFRRSYAADRLPPITPAEREALPTLSGCIACGLCDAGEGARKALRGALASRYRAVRERAEAGGSPIPKPEDELPDR